VADATESRQTSIETAAGIDVFRVPWAEAPAGVNGTVGIRRAASDHGDEQKEMDCAHGGPKHGRAHGSRL
jgi:hypothetical protein